ncbi:hypothetical protein QUA30_07905 [Microcoleus sp. Pol14C2]|uniref:hypothetical protein n=1 Tax=unclassified Microcoleus TaxID=2642155 RepID=UPI002FD26B7A
MIDYIEIELSHGEIVDFLSYPLDQAFDCLEGKLVNEDLCNALKDPTNYRNLHSDQGVIFLGFASDRPDYLCRFPVWLPADLITNHILIGGAIGSGKTTLTYRLIAGVLENFGTVVIGEAKGGQNGYAEGAAFTNLALYLQKRSNRPAYRWPRGNCWFNSLPYLRDKSDRDSFLQAIRRLIQVGGDMQLFIDNAVEIASLLIEYMQMDTKNDPKKCTLRKLVYFLRYPSEVEKNITKLINLMGEVKGLDSTGKADFTKIKDIKHRLETSNFFRMLKDEYVGTRSGINRLANEIEKDEDVLYYSEPHNQGLDGQPLVELIIDDILYNRSLVIVSQPLAKPSSESVGVLFWDSLLNQILEIGPKLPKNKAGKRREKVAVFLDETHRLPVGQLGDAGEILREFGVGLIEITPAVVDTARWEKNKSVWQTMISLSPGIDAVTKEIYAHLPAIPQDDITIRPYKDAQGRTRIGYEINDKSSQKQGNDNPGVSWRSLQYTGNRTALLWLNNNKALFWIDFESELLKHIDGLLKDAISPKASRAVKAAVDYALGLVKEFRV